MSMAYETVVYSQVLTYIAGRIEVVWIDQNCPNIKMAARGITPGHLWSESIYCTLNFVFRVILDLFVPPHRSGSVLKCFCLISWFPSVQARNVKTKRYIKIHIPRKKKCKSFQELIAWFNIRQDFFLLSSPSCFIPSINNLF